MSYSSKRSIVSIIAGVILAAAYIIYALGQNAPAPEDLKSWAILMLIFIGIGVGAMVVIQIVFHIALAIGITIKDPEQNSDRAEREIESMAVEDERQKLIDLKVGKIGYICIGIGFVAMLVALAFDITAVCALHIMLGAVVLGSITEGITGIYYNEKGVRNG